MVRVAQKTAEQRCADRLDTKIMPEPNTGCWLWLGAINKNGYGIVHVKENGRNVKRRAHRIVYESHIGPIQVGLVLDHLCRIRHCVNPSHLEPVTQKTNVIRGTAAESLGTRQRNKTHCPQGHEYTPENTIIKKRSNIKKIGRQCRECNRVSFRKWKSQQLVSQKYKAL